jgi:hypothetical protein
VKQIAVSEDGSEALYLEEKSGLVLEVPGHPTLKNPSPEGFEAAAAVGLCGTIALAELPVTLRIYCSHIGDEPRTLSNYARSHVERRARGRVKVHTADAEKRARWDVEAAASACYRLSPDVIPPGHEVKDVKAAEAISFLLRRPLLIVIETQFLVEKTPLASWTAFASALHDGLRFSRADAASFSGIRWPRSEFLLPGLGGLSPAAQALIPAVQGAFRLARAATRQELCRRAARLLGGSEPKETAFSAEDRLLLDQLLGDVCETRAQEDLLTATTARIQNSHDVRGFALILLAALDAPSDVEPAVAKEAAPPSLDTFLHYDE